MYNNKVKGSSKARKIRVVIRKGFTQQMEFELDPKREEGFDSIEKRRKKYPVKKVALGPGWYGLVD